MFERLFIIAEAGSNHNGNLDTAVELVYRAKDAGADAIKFQDFSLNTLFAPSYYEKRLSIEDTGWRQLIDKCSFKQGWHDVVAKAARKAGIHYFSTPYNLRAVDIIDKFVPFYKISSGDITYLQLLQKIGKRGKGVFLSTGASRLEEIDNAVRTLEKFNLQFICIMHCIMLYPPPDRALNINFIDTLRSRYNYPIGLSDHTLGFDATLLALGKGIRALEKHFTLDRNQEGLDHRNSFDPDQFGELVKKVRLCEKMLGNRERTITPREKLERVYARRGIYAKRDLNKGERISKEMVDFLRPNTGFGAEEFNRLKNRVLNTDVSKGTPLKGSMFK